MSDKRGSSGGFLRNNRKVIVSGASFVFLAVGSIIVLSLPAMQEGPVYAFTATIASVTGTLLKLWNPAIEVSGRVITLAGFRMEIVNGCNGAYVTAFLAAAIIVTPGAWWRRLTGIFAGAVFIYVLNIIRAGSLFVMGNLASREVFYFAHTYVWQTLVVLFAVAFYVLWLGILPAEGPGSAEAGGRADSQGNIRGSSGSSAVDGDPSGL